SHLRSSAPLLPYRLLPPPWPASLLPYRGHARLRCSCAARPSAPELRRTARPSAPESCRAVLPAGPSLGGVAPRRPPLRVVPARPPEPRRERERPKFRGRLLVLQISIELGPPSRRRQRPRLPPPDAAHGRCCVHAARGHTPDPALATSTTARVICRRAAGRPPARSSPPPPSPPPAPAKNRWRASPWRSSHAPPRSPPPPAPPRRRSGRRNSAPATTNKERPSRQRRSTHHGGIPGEHQIDPIAPNTAKEDGFPGSVLAS
ncbi:unnamed protein product, partial [Urochloa humidicola]